MKTLMNGLSLTIALAAGLSLAISLPVSAIAADAALDAQIEQALGMGGDAGVATAAEFEQQLKERFPKCFARFEAMAPAQREQVIDVYQDSGYLPQVVTVIRELTGPAD